MQGLESLNEFKSFVSKIGGLGRYEDTYIVHAAEGETVVPMEVLDRNPVLKKRLFKTMVDMGIEPGRYIVGNELNSKNPVTGQPEFFFKWVGRRLRKAAADVSGYVAPIVGAMYGPAAGAAAGAMLGQYKRENPGDPSQWAQMAMRGGIAGVGTNLATGQSPFSLGGGMRGAYGLDTYNPLKIGKAMMGKLPTEGEAYDQFLKENPEYSKLGERQGWEAFKDPKTDEWRFMENFGSSDKEKVSFDNFVKEEGGGAFDASTLTPSQEDIFLEKYLNANKAKDATLAGMDVMEAAKLYGLSTAALGWLIDSTSSDENVGQQIDPYEPHGLSYDSMLNPKLQWAQDMPIVPAMAQGGVMDLQGGGESTGPGTGTSDSIPAMLSDGEFVMTAKAVRGAGGGDRREGARKMYEAMDRMEARA